MCPRPFIPVHTHPCFTPGMPVPTVHAHTHTHIHTHTHTNTQVFQSLCAPYNSIGQLYEILSEPILMRTMPLGKHKGAPMARVPNQYLEWIIRTQSTGTGVFDEDLLYTVVVEMQRRVAESEM